MTATEAVRPVASRQRREAIVVGVGAVIVPTARGPEFEARRIVPIISRDGTINVKKGFLVNYEEIELIEGAAEAIRAINNSGYLAIIVTNQPQIARGECSFEQLKMIHNKLETELGNHGAIVDGIYYCPHHTDRGFEGERVEYKINCDCRKPKPGMFYEAAKEFNIDLSQSFMIGDSNIDIQAGLSAGCKDCILIETNAPLELLNAVNSILNL